jgi:hypothetical protein
LAPSDPTILAQSTRDGIRDLALAMQSARQEGAAWIQEVALPELESLTRGQNGINVYRQRSHPS